MGKCCRAEYICGLTEFIEDVVGGGGGGGGTPGAPVNSVQYNSAGAFAGDSAFTYSGTALALAGTGSAITLNRSASALTTSLPALSITQTWNAVGTTFIGAVINVTDTASAAASKILDAQLGGVSRLNVNKSGLTAINGPAIAGNGEILTLTTSLGTASLRVGTGNQLIIGGDIAAVGNASLISATAHLRFGAGSDAGILYTAAGALKVTDGSTGSGTITAASATLTPAAALTTSAPGLTLTQTWNAIGTTFTGSLINITDTASAAGSKIVDWQIGSSSKASVSKDGINITPAWSGTGTATTPLLVNVTADPGPANPASKLLDLQVGGSSKFAIKKDGTANASYFITDGSGGAGIYARSTVPVLAMGLSDDVQLTRDAADTLAQRRGTNRQTYCIYNTYNGTNDEFLQLRFNGSNVAEIHTVKTGAGIARALSLGTGGVERLNIAATGLGTATFTGVVIAPSLIGSQAGASGAAVNVSSNTGFIAFGAASDVGLSRLGAGILGITNGSTGPGKLAIDKVQGTPFERLKMEWDTTNHVARIGTEKGTGGTARDLAFITDDQVRMTVYGAGGLNVAGGLTAWSLESTSGPIRITTSTPPASSGAAGNAGQITWDSDYLYVAVGSSSWKRIALSTF